MPKFLCSIPYAGSLLVSVEAEDEKAAIDAALRASFRIEPDKDQESGIDYVEPNECETLQDITRGNVCYAPLRSASAEREDDPAAED